MSLLKDDLSGSDDDNDELLKCEDTLPKPQRRPQKSFSSRDKVYSSSYRNSYSNGKNDNQGSKSKLSSPSSSDVEIISDKRGNEKTDIWPKELYGTTNTTPISVIETWKARSSPLSSSSTKKKKTAKKKNDDMTNFLVSDSHVSEEDNLSDEDYNDKSHHKKRGKSKKSSSKTNSGEKKSKRSRNSKSGESNSNSNSNSNSSKTRERTDKVGNNGMYWSDKTSVWQDDSHLRYDNKETSENNFLSSNRNNNNNSSSRSNIGSNSSNNVISSRHRSSGTDNKEISSSSLVDEDLEYITTGIDDGSTVGDDKMLSQSNIVDLT